MWKLTDKAKALNWEPLPGIPWDDMTDDEFKDAAKVYAAQGWPDRALRDSGHWEHVEDKAEKVSTAKEGT